MQHLIANEKKLEERTAKRIVAPVTMARKIAEAFLVL
jgi:hypothetical protein